MNQDDDIERLRSEAIAWVVRLRPEHATAADVAAFKDWCGQDKDHAKAFVQARSVWDAVGPAWKKETAPGTLNSPEFSKSQKVQLGRRAFLGGAAMASAAALTYAMVRPPLGLWPSVSEWTADYRTVKGEQRQIALGHNVAIEMNTETSIGLRSAETNLDRIELVAGEGMIRTKSHELEVIAAGGRTRATDALFNIRKDGDKVSVTCVHGHVLVLCRSSSVELPVGSQVSYTEGGLGQVISADPETVTSWRDGFLVFHDTRLSDVIAEVNRYRKGHIVVMSEALATRSVNGRFALSRLNDIVEKFQNAFGARVTTLPGGVVILS